jgi:hypothetical protein
MCPALTHIRFSAAHLNTPVLYPSAALFPC